MSLDNFDADDFGLVSAGNFTHAHLLKRGQMGQWRLFQRDLEFTTKLFRQEDTPEDMNWEDLEKLSELYEVERVTSAETKILRHVMKGGVYCCRFPLDWRQNGINYHGNRVSRQYWEVRFPCTPQRPSFQTRVYLAARAGNIVILYMRLSR